MPAKDMKADHAWHEAVENTRRRSPASFDQWFSGVQFDGLEQGLLSLSARDEFVRDWVKEHFLPDLLHTLERNLGDNAQGLRVRWNISSELATPVSEPRRVAARPRPCRLRCDPSAVTARRIRAPRSPPR